SESAKAFNNSVKQFFIANESLIRADYIRQFRDMELAATDGLANAPSDAPPDVQARADAWKAYRQALRDITTQPGFPMNITVPQRPDNQ
ncbi:phage tail assembly chaperone, partial [Burkholderia sp. SIMBA_045]